MRVLVSMKKLKCKIKISKVKIMSFIFTRMYIVVDMYVGMCAWVYDCVYI